MISIGQILLDLSTTVLAILTGILAYGKLPVFYRILFFQALAYLIIDVCAITYSNNGVLYNAGMVVESGLLFFAAHTFFHTRTSKYVLLLLYSGFLSVLLFDFCFSGIKAFAVHAYITSGVFITGIYLCILFLHFHHHVRGYITLPLLLSCIGILIFFAGMVPYLSMMPYLQELDAGLSQKLFKYTVLLMGILRYLLVAIAFMLLGKQFSVLKRNCP